MEYSCFKSQVAASTNKEVDCHIPNYPNLPPQLVCQLHDVTMHVSFITSSRHTITHIYM